MKRHINIVVILLLIMSGVFFTKYHIVRGKALVISNLEQGSKTIIPTANRAFAVGYLHSVHKTPVMENFFIEDDNSLTLKDVEYSSLGVGMPYTDEGGVFVNDDGRFVLRFDRTYDVIPIRLSPIPEHSIHVGDECFPLMEFAKPNELIDISATDRWSLGPISRKER